MTKSTSKRDEAITIVRKDGSGFLSCILSDYSREQSKQHGGWEESEPESAAALVRLSRKGKITKPILEATRAGFIDFLNTEMGLSLIGKMMEPYVVAAPNYVDEDDGE